jgi:hypothetical protein
MLHLHLKVTLPYVRWLSVGDSGKGPYTALRQSSADVNQTCALGMFGAIRCDTICGRTIFARNAQESTVSSQRLGIQAGVIRLCLEHEMRILPSQHIGAKEIMTIE